MQWPQRVLRPVRKLKFEAIRYGHLAWYQLVMAKLARKKGEMEFQCNICGMPSKARWVELCHRETPSCGHCGSNLRGRSLIYLLSMALFGEPRALPDFPKLANVTGLGMSDWEGYAQPLAKIFAYTNTYYHKPPQFDICTIPETMVGRYDFVLSSDVFEHVLPPVGQAFANLHTLLKPGGHAILSVPYMLFEECWEHFPELYDFGILEKNGKKILRNLTRSGQEQLFNQLTFHGGGGSTLELRIFTESSLLRELTKAGFVDIRFQRCHMPSYGIVWPINWSLPITATRRLTEPGDKTK